MQRLDKILSSAGAGSRKELRAAIRAGRVRVDGTVCCDESAKFDEQAAEITLDGEAVELLRPALILLNKPAGFLTAADDPRQKTVMELIPERYRKFGVMPVGRLDKDTEGLCF
ncbi:MAG: S4 domain-containing protein [Oscillospiraceae bacterium]